MNRELQSLLSQLLDLAQQMLTVVSDPAVVQQAIVVVFLLVASHLFATRLEPAL